MEDTIEMREAPASNDALPSFDFGKKKRKKGKVSSTTSDAPLPIENLSLEDKSEEMPSSSLITTATTDNSNGMYSYDFLITRFYDQLRTKRPDDKDSVSGDIQKLRTPNVGREGSRKSVWSNFRDTCERVKRSPEQVMQFYMSELQCDCNMRPDGSLVIRGIYKQDSILCILKKYISLFVQCPVCKGPQTRSEKEQGVHFIRCACGARSSVQEHMNAMHKRVKM